MVTLDRLAIGRRKTLQDLAPAIKQLGTQHPALPRHDIDQQSLI